jgi:hypothetical protein
MNNPKVEAKWKVVQDHFCPEKMPGPVLKLVEGGDGTLYFGPSLLHTRQKRY